MPVKCAEFRLRAQAKEVDAFIGGGLSAEGVAFGAGAGDKEVVAFYVTPRVDQGVEAFDAFEPADK